MTKPEVREIRKMIESEEGRGGGEGRGVNERGIREVPCMYA